MNLRTFNTLMKESGLKQESSEWKLFLEFCSMYLKSNKIKNPVVVELGTGEGKQKKFWKQLFEAEYIGVDTHDVLSLRGLKEKLRKRPINILFIDAFHSYEDVKADYELFSPLCDGLVVLQSIETFRNTGRKSAQVWKLWDEIKGGAYTGPIVTIFKRRSRGCQRGIGIIIKR